MNVLKHCTTRWLSLERAVKRLLHLRPALHAYFDREAEVGNDRARKIAEKLASDETKLYVSFCSICPEASEHLQHFFPVDYQQDWVNAR